jgi:hypothetical protein
LIKDIVKYIKGYRIKRGDILREWKTQNSSMDWNPIGVRTKG